MDAQPDALVRQMYEGGNQYTNTVEPPLATKADPQQGWRSVLEEAAVDVTSLPSKRIHARRKLIVGLSAAAVIASGLVFLHSRELIGADSWSWSTRSAVLEVGKFIRGNDTTSDDKPHRISPAVVIFRPRHSAVQRSGRAAQSAEGTNPTEAIQQLPAITILGSQLINPATGRAWFNSGVQVSKELPAITILGSGQFPERCHAATPAAGHSGMPPVPPPANPADPTDPAPATTAGKFFMPQP